MDQELFTPQFSSVSSSRIITPHQPLPERPCSICRRSALCKLFTHIYLKERIWCRFFAVSFCLARENFPIQVEGITPSEFREKWGEAGH